MERAARLLLRGLDWFAPMIADCVLLERYMLVTVRIRLSGRYGFALLGIMGWILLWQGLIGMVKNGDLSRLRWITYLLYRYSVVAR